MKFFLKFFNGIINTHIAFCLVLILPIILNGLSEDYSEAKKVKYSIDNVVLYWNKAWLDSTIKLHLIKGDNSFIVQGLPLERYASFLNKTINVYIKETNPEYMIREYFSDISLEKRDISVELNILKEKLEELIDKKRALMDRLKVLDSSLKYYLNLIEFQKQRREGMLKDIEPKTVIILGNTIKNELNKIYSKKRDINNELNKLNDDISILNSKISQIDKNKTKRVRTLYLRIFSNIEKDVKIGLKYIIEGCGWKPFYEVNYDSNKKKIKLCYYAEIYQLTEEPWKNIKLSLATGSPLFDVTLPMVSPWIVSEKRELVNSLVLKRRYKAIPESRDESNRGLFAESKNKKVKNILDIEKDELQLNIPLSDKYTIPNTGKRKKFKIMDINIDKLNVFYTLIPSKSQYGYLTVEFKNPVEMVLLKGEASLFVNGSYSGKGSFVKNLYKDEEIQFSFGACEEIKFEKKDIMKERGINLAGNKKQIEIGYRIEINNFKDKNVEIYIKEPLPISENKSIKIFYSDILPEPYKIEDKGIYVWKFDIPSREKEIIEYKFKIIYPAEMIIDY